MASFCAEPLDKTLLLFMLPPASSSPGQPSKSRVALRGAADDILARLHDCASAGEEELEVSGGDWAIDAEASWLALASALPSAPWIVRSRRIKLHGTTMGRLLTGCVLDGAPVGAILDAETSSPEDPSSFCGLVVTPAFRGAPPPTSALPRSVLTA